MKNFFPLIVFAAATATTLSADSITFSADEQSFTFGSGATQTTWTIPAFSEQIGPAVFSGGVTTDIEASTVIPALPGTYIFDYSAGLLYAYSWDGITYSAPIATESRDNGGGSILVDLRVNTSGSFPYPFEPLQISFVSAVGLPGTPVDLPIQLSAAAPEPSTWLLLLAGLAVVLPNAPKQTRFSVCPNWNPDRKGGDSPSPDSNGGD